MVVVGNIHVQKMCDWTWFCMEFWLSSNKTCFVHIFRVLKIHELSNMKNCSIFFFSSVSLELKKHVLFFFFLLKNFTFIVRKKLCRHVKCHWRRKTPKPTTIFLLPKNGRAFDGNTAKMRFGSKVTMQSSKWKINFGDTCLSDQNAFSFQRKPKTYVL